MAQKNNQALEMHLTKLSHNLYVTAFIDETNHLCRCVGTLQTLLTIQACFSHIKHVFGVLLFCKLSELLPVKKVNS